MDQLSERIEFLQTIERTLELLPELQKTQLDGECLEADLGKDLKFSVSWSPDAPDLIWETPEVRHSSPFGTAFFSLNHLLRALPRFSRKRELLSFRGGNTFLRNIEVALMFMPETEVVIIHGDALLAHLRQNFQVVARVNSHKDVELGGRYAEAEADWTLPIAFVPLHAPGQLKFLLRPLLENR